MHSQCPEGRDAPAAWIARATYMRPATSHAKGLVLGWPWSTLYVCIVTTGPSYWHPMKSASTIQAAQCTHDLDIQGL